MKWIDELIDFNETKKNWVVPRKGTKAYIKVMKVVRPETVVAKKIRPMMKASRSQA